MQTSLAISRNLFNHQRKATKIMATRLMEPCDVFLNHRSTDTKRTVATRLYDNLKRHGINPFLDEKNMKPGDKLFEKINNGIIECKIGVAVFSPCYCESYFCLHELALLTALNKKVIPIFFDVNPSQLKVVNNAKWSKEEHRRFRWALDEAKYTVGLTYNSSKGNLSKFVTNASEIIIGNMIELENEEEMKYTCQFLLRKLI